MRAETVRIDGHEHDEIDAYLAQPPGRAAIGGVVVLHHMPGLDEHTKEVTRRFAAEGFLAICPNLYSREVPGARPEEAFPIIWKQGGVDDRQVVGDVAGAAAFLAGLPQSNGRTGVIGYCSGGRQALLAACRTPLSAAVDCYGAFVLRAPDPKLGLRMTPMVDDLDGLGCPLLGLFGAEDTDPGPDEVAELAAALTARGKDFEFHTHDGAGHAFFATNRPNYRVQAASDGWQQVLEFCRRHLS